MARAKHSTERERAAPLTRRSVLGWLGSVAVTPWALGAQGRQAGERLLRALERAGASGQVDAVRLWGQWILRREDLGLIERLTARQP